MLDIVMGHVMDGVCDGRRLSQRLSQAEGVTEVGKTVLKSVP